MIDRVLGGCIVFILVLFIIVGTIENILPINANIEMKSACRGALISVEQNGALTPSARTSLENKLNAIGLSNINVTVSGGSAQGSMVNLLVTADYSYSKVINILNRQTVIQPMRYDKTTTVRWVIN